MRYRNGIDQGQTVSRDPLGELGRLCGIDALSRDDGGHCSLMLDGLRTINVYWPRGQIWMCLSVEVPSPREAQMDVALQRAAALALAAWPTRALSLGNVSALSGSIRRTRTLDKRLTSMHARLSGEGIAMVRLVDGRICLQKTVDARMETGLRLLHSIDVLCDTARRCEASWTHSGAAASLTTRDAGPAHADPSCGGTKRRKRFSPAQY